MCEGDTARYGGFCGFAVIPSRFGGILWGWMWRERWGWSTGLGVEAEGPTDVRVSRAVQVVGREKVCGSGQQKLTLSLCMCPQVAGVSPGHHLVPAEAAGGAEDRLLRLLLGTEHQPQVPAGAADSGGYLWRSHNWVRVGWTPSFSGWQRVSAAKLLSHSPRAAALSPLTKYRGF